MTDLRCIRCGVPHHEHPDANKSGGVGQLIPWEEDVCPICLDRRRELAKRAVWRYRVGAPQPGRLRHRRRDRARAGDAGGRHLRDGPTGTRHRPSAVGPHVAHALQEADRPLTRARAHRTHGQSTVDGEAGAPSPAGHGRGREPTPPRTWGHSSTSEPERDENHPKATSVLSVDPITIVQESDRQPSRVRDQPRVGHRVGYEHRGTSVAGQRSP